MFESTKVGINIPKIALKVVYTDIEFDLSCKNSGQYLLTQCILYSWCFFYKYNGRKRRKSKFQLTQSYVCTEIKYVNGI